MSAVKQVLDIRKQQQYIKPHQQRIKADGGSLVRDDRAKEFFDTLKTIGIYDSCLLAISPDFGIKTRVSGSNTFVSKAYSLVTPQAKYGPELITNQADRDFSSDTGWWTKGVGWVIADGSLNVNTPSNTFTYRGVAVSVGLFYKITYTISNYISGSVRVYVGSSSSNVNQANGTYTVILYNPGPNRDIYIQAGAGGFIGSVDNVSVTEVLNSLDGSPTDATQTTSTSQPYLGNIIAPNERPSFKNQNGQSNYLTHPTISFAANEAWSVTTVLNFNNMVSGVVNYCGNYIVSTSSIGATGGDIRIVNKNVNVSTLYIKGFEFIGKNTILTIVYNANNRFFIYANGVFKGQITMDGSFDFSGILKGREYYLPGSLHAHIIRAQALTPSQVASEANFLRSLYPEIPSVRIGTQTWATSNCEMVATPQGNLIQNITLNSNVENITNVADREFSSDTGFWNKSVGVTIADGVCHCVNVTDSSALAKPGVLTFDKYYKCTVTVSNYVQGGVAFRVGLAPLGPYVTANGTYTFYLKCDNTSTNLYLRVMNPTTLDIDNVSVQEVGWADATNLYDYVYANTAGTVEQKTYAAVKAAAMWRYYNNDASLGAIYGKLYNDYAMKLLAMDIAYYNTANPSTPWGWDIPLESDWSTLQTTVNNNAEALKKDGTVYWSSPNAGTNSSLFTAIPAGYVKEDGTFSGLNTAAIFASKDNIDIPKVGKSIRLIKK